MTQLRISNLSKKYANGVKALDGISLEIATGMFGLLGPNGAGKSTLMRILATLQEPDVGTVTLGELDVLKQKNEVRHVLGYLPQQFGLYPKVSAERLLHHLAILKGITHRGEREEMVRALLVKTNLFAVRKQPLGGFSGGMKQRFGIAQALLNHPRLLIVDEPTAGLDPAERNRFYNLLSELGEQAIVLLSTHIVDDVRELCPKMAIIHRGRVLLQGNPNELMARLQGNIYQKAIQKEELEGYRNQYTVINEKLLQGKPVIDVFSEIPPSTGFKAIKADIEHLYFSQLQKASRTSQNR